MSHHVQSIARLGIRAKPFASAPPCPLILNALLLKHSHVPKRGCIENSISIQPLYFKLSVFNKQQTECILHSSFHLMASALGLQFIYIINASPRHNPFKLHLMVSALGLQFILRYRATYLEITKYLLTLQKATGSLITRVIILSSPFTNW